MGDGGEESLLMGRMRLEDDECDDLAAGHDSHETVRAMTPPLRPRLRHEICPCVESRWKLLSERVEAQARSEQVFWKGITMTELAFSPSSSMTYLMRCHFFLTLPETPREKIEIPGSHGNRNRPNAQPPHIGRY